MFNSSRWAAIGAACAVTLGAGGLMSASATIDTGERSVFVPIAPCRVMDTRPAPLTVGLRSAPLNAAETHTILVRGTNGNCTIPSDAAGLSLNVTAVNPTAASFLTVFPADVTRPVASNLNWSAGQPAVPNAVTSDISADGRISFYNLTGTVDVVADIVGYYVDHNHDDRYFTEGEIDTRLAGKADTPTGTGLLILDPAAFRADDQTSDYFHSFSGGSINTVGGVCLAAPVYLPDGVTVTRVTANVDDTNATNDASFGVRSNPPGLGLTNEMAAASSSGAPGTILIADDSITAPVIDNDVNSYYATVCLPSGQTVYDMQIFYTYP